MRIEGVIVMRLTAEEKLMYEVMKAIYDSGIPIDFKGSMVLKACLLEAGYSDEIRHAKLYKGRKQTVKRAADNKRRYAPGEGSIPPVLLSGVSKGACPLAHDFACKV